MNIGIDVRILERNMTGIGRVLKTVLDELPRLDPNNKYYLFSYEGVETGSNSFINIKTVKSFLPQKIFSPFWCNFILPWYLKKNKIDLFYSVNQLIPLIKIKNIKYIFVLHDVIYKVDKFFHPYIYRKYLQFFTYFSIRSSDLILTDSEYSKRDILKYYSVSENKVKVVYPAVDKKFCESDLSEQGKVALKRELNLPDRIILYVGVIENRKNILGILKIADEVIKKDKNIKFVLIGKMGYGSENIIREANKRQNVIYLGKVDDQLLKNIYGISTIFLFPSFYEGFGYPPLEAMKSGVPVICANNTSLSEVIGNGAILHDANDLNSFVCDIFRLIENKTLYQEMKEKGLERVQVFNSTNTAQNLISVFNSLLSNN